MEINGYNFLLKTNLGFWRQLCYDKMPQSKFFVQENDFAFQKLVTNSSLPHFTTNLVKTDKERWSFLLLTTRRASPTTFIAKIQTFTSH
ncbi:hypothetical protein ACHBIF_04885 [Streptococcus sp. A11]|uniref:hypothetical protein n=1 Tax=unclassified Streptococcus TaxID=2608887 RepID=UPI00374DB3B6